MDIFEELCNFYNQSCPCKGCLVRPVCSTVCEKFRKTLKNISPPTTGFIEQLFITLRSR